MFDKALLAAKLILTTTGSLFDESKPHLIDENGMLTPPAHLLKTKRLTCFVDLPESYTISQLYELLTGGGNLNEEYLNNEVTHLIRDISFMHCSYCGRNAY
jgi:hypothetical protein